MQRGGDLRGPPGHDAAGGAALAVDCDHNTFTDPDLDPNHDRRLIVILTLALSLARALNARRAAVFIAYH